MRVRCVSNRPDDVALERVRRRFFQGGWSAADVGREYLVYGIGFHDGGVWYELESAGSCLFDAPTELFEVLDPRASRHWRLGMRGEAVVLCPELLLEPYFHDDLSDGVPQVVERFWRLTHDLEAEMAAEPWGLQPGTVSPEEVVRLLVAARPDVATAAPQPDPDAPVEPYVEISGLAGDLVDALRTSRTAYFESLFHVVERLLEEGAVEVRELLIVGLLESLQDISLKSSIPLEAWERWLGPSTLSAWRRLASMWGDEVSPEDLRRLVAGVVSGTPQCDS
jgi:hypothetical protein